MADYTNLNSALNSLSTAEDGIQGQFENLTSPSNPLNIVDLLSFQKAIGAQNTRITVETNFIARKNKQSERILDKGS